MFIFHTYLSGISFIASDFALSQSILCFASLGRPENLVYTSLLLCFLSVTFNPFNYLVGYVYFMEDEKGERGRQTYTGQEGKGLTHTMQHSPGYRGFETRQSALRD